MNLNIFRIKIIIIIKFPVKTEVIPGMLKHLYV